MRTYTEADRPLALKDEGGLLPKPALDWQHKITRIFLHKRRQLYRAGAVGALCGIAFGFWNTAYQSTSSLMPPVGDTSGRTLMAGLAGPQGAAGSDLLGAIASDRLGMKSPGALYLGILGSRTIQDHIIQHFDLRRVYWVRTWAAARKELAIRTQAAEDRKSGIITVAVSDRSPVRAAAINQEYIAELNRIVVDSMISSARKEREFLEQRLRALKVQLDSDAMSLSQFSSKTGAVDISQQGKSMLEAGAAVQGELIGAKSQLKELETIYTSDNVRVQALRAQIAELEVQLQQMSGESTSELGYPGLRKLPALAAEYANHYRQVRVDEAVYEVLTKQYELAKVQEAKETPTVKVLDAPDVPEKKSSIPMLVFLFSGSLGGCALVIAWFYCKEKWDSMSEDNPTKVVFFEVYSDLRRSSIWRRIHIGTK